MEKIVAEDAETLSADIIDQNLIQLKSLFPEAFAEGKINFETLKQLLGGEVDEREEKYGLNWHGKRRARQLALTPSSGTLRPCPEDSVDWDTTRNLMIEGDNLEVLKLLQKSYSGKVKLIYIDPPYNTGKDFVYPDDFQDNIKNYQKQMGWLTEEGEKVTSLASRKNTSNLGRYHTHWLNMLYPRLKLAKNLLQEDGVIFISIDDSEVGNLRSLCDEIFGAENFCGVIKRRAARKTAFLSKGMTDMCDYVVAYVRSDSAAPLTAGEVSDGTRPVFNGGNKIAIRFLRNGATAKCADAAYKAGVYSARSVPFELLDELRIENGKVVGEVRILGPWRMNQDVLDKTLFVTRNFGLRRTILPEELEKAKLLNDLLDDKKCYNEAGSEELLALYGVSAFSNPKPSGLLEYLLAAASVGLDEIVLDFFAGSGTMGHAIMAKNIDEANRRYILVQLPEPLDPSYQEQKVAADFCDSLGKPRTIAELTKERLRRTGKKIKDENPMFAGDLGFRVFKLDSSNIRTWEPNSEDIEKSLLDSIEHIKPGRSETDILFELLLKLGLDLTAPIEQKNIAGKMVHNIGAGALLVCLDTSITRKEAEPLALGIVEWHEALGSPEKNTVVFRDSAFADDVSKTNLAAILQQHSLKNVRSL